MISPDGYISIYVDCTLNNLIYLKFHIERQLTMKFSDIDKKTQYVVSFISDNPDIYNIFTVYNNNIKSGFSLSKTSEKLIIPRPILLEIPIVVSDESNVSTFSCIMKPSSSIFL